mgnify:CR=1 FL=1
MCVRCCWFDSSSCCCACCGVQGQEGQEGHEGPVPRSSSRRVACACRCGAWQEVDGAAWLPLSCRTPLQQRRAQEEATGRGCCGVEVVVRSHSSGGGGGVKGVKLFPFARWLLLQLWRAAGGGAPDCTRVRFFATRISLKRVVPGALAAAGPSAGE